MTSRDTALPASPPNREPFWRRVTLTSLWGGVLIIHFLPAVVLNANSVGFLTLTLTSLGLLVALLLVVQFFLLTGWTRRLLTLAVLAVFVVGGARAAHHALFGDPELAPIHALVYPFSALASLILIWNPRRWYVMFIALMVVLGSLAVILTLRVKAGQVPFSVLATDQVRYELPFWFGEEVNPVVGSLVINTNDSKTPNHLRKQWFHVVSHRTTHVQLPPGFWLPSRPWGDSVALGGTLSTRHDGEAALDNHLRVVNASGDVEDLDAQIADSYPAVASMLGGWTFRSEQSPWQLVPFLHDNERTAYDPSRHAIMARSLDSGEEVFLDGLTTLLFVQWDDRDTMTIVELLPLSADSPNPPEPSGDSADIEEILANIGAKLEYRPHEARLLSVHVPSGTRTERARLSIPDLERVYFLDGDRLMVYSTNISSEVGVLDWKAGGTEFITTRAQTGSIGLAQTRLGLRLAFVEEPVGTGTPRMVVTDARSILHTLPVVEGETIQQVQIAPDGAKVLFSRRRMTKLRDIEIPTVAIEVWDLDHDTVVTLDRHAAMAGILESIAVMAIYHWYRNPWSPNSREVLVPHMTFRWSRDRGMYSDLRLYHYEDWAEKKWGVRPTGEAVLNDSH